MNDAPIVRCKFYIEQSLANLEIESPKVDFKRDWYNLKAKKGISEFLKDLTSIVNTVGLNGYIVIGYDEKNRKIVGTAFRDSGLKDTSLINDLIIKNCSDLFDYEYFEFTYDGSTIGLIHVPPCLQKPIFIKNYQTFDKNGDLIKEEQHRVFIRKNNSVYPANKYDFDLMYYDRKNIVPEHDYSLDLIDVKIKSDPVSLLKMNPRYKLQHHIDLVCSFENLGRRNISIKDANILLISNNDTIQFSDIAFYIEGKGVTKLDKTKTLIFPIGTSMHFRIKSFIKIKTGMSTISEYDECKINFILSNNKVITNSFRTKDFRVENLNLLMDNE